MDCIIFLYKLGGFELFIKKFFSLSALVKIRFLIEQFENQSLFPVVNFTNSFESCSNFLFCARCRRCLFLYQSVTVGKFSYDTPF